jgi:hypothetical protein
MEIIGPGFGHGHYANHAMRFRRAVNHGRGRDANLRHHLVTSPGRHWELHLSPESLPSIAACRSLSDPKGPRM